MVFKVDRLEQVQKKAPPKEKKHTVLLVDDEEPNLKILSTLLGRHYNVLTAFSAEEAWDILTGMDQPEDQVGLILCDQRMSGMTGVSFFEKVNTQMERTKRILVTGYLDMEALISSINEAHIYKFIMKPFNAPDLMLSVKRALEAYDMERQLEDHVKNLEDKVKQRTSELENKNQQLEAANEALEAASLTDPLTGLKNRRFLLKHLETDIAMVRRAYRDFLDGRSSQPPTDLLFFIMDLDHFKNVNDTYGHAAGDQVLLQVREILEELFRESDFLVRWGGEEFLVVARFMKRECAGQLAERMRERLANYDFNIGDGRTINKTCSIGFAAYPFMARSPDLLNWSQVIDVADACLYAAKRSGRDGWVGLNPNQNTPDTHLLRDILEKPEALIAADEINLYSSHGADVDLIWKKESN